MGHREQLSGGRQLQHRGRERAFLRLGIRNLRSATLKLHGLGKVTLPLLPQFPPWRNEDGRYTCLTYVAGGVGAQKMYLKCAYTYIPDQKLPNGSMGTCSQAGGIGIQR